MSRLKVYTADDATPGYPRRRGRLLGPEVTATLATARPGSPAASRQVLFSDQLVSSLSQHEQPRIRPGTVFLLPCREVFCMPLAGSSFAASTKAASAVPAETAYEVRPLTSSPLLLRPVLREDHVEKKTVRERVNKSFQGPLVYCHLFTNH